MKVKIIIHKRREIKIIGKKAQFDFKINKQVLNC